MRGRAIRLSPAHRVRNDILYFGTKAPILPVQRRMALGALVAARKACPHRPPWTALFLKAYALLAREVPELRRAYIGLPFPHLYQYPASIATVTFERRNGDDVEVFAALIKDPASRSLAEIVDTLRRLQETPLSELKDFRRALIFGRLPTPLRRFLMGLGLNIGRQRANFFGTFALSVYSALGADSLRPLFPCTTVLNYGVFAADGSVDVRLNYDHRVMDGATVARALQAFEQILTHAMVDELARWR